MAQPNWVKIRARYERGGISYRDLAESENVPFPTLRDRAKREGWRVSRDRVVTEIVSVTSQKVIERLAINAADVMQIATDAYLLGASKAKAALEMADEPKDIKTSLEGVRLAVDGLRQALGITNELPADPNAGKAVIMTPPDSDNWKAHINDGPVAT
jgi:hypothetical protein